MAIGVGLGWLVLLTTHRWHPGYVFLDCACINQVDASKKMAGIGNLASFLGSSSTLLVLWDERYFTRLWCCYEIAAFAFMNDRTLEDALHILPVRLPAIAIGLHLNFHPFTPIWITDFVVRVLTTPDPASLPWEAFRFFVLLPWFVS
jgi:hypothetical protein